MGDTMPKETATASTTSKASNKTCDNCRKRKIKCVQPDSKTGNPTHPPPPPPPNFDGHPYPQDSLAAIEAVASAAIKGEGSGSSHHHEYAETGMSENVDGLPGLPCEGCAKVGLPCTYDYVRKKPGRKNSFALAMLAQQQSFENPDYYRYQQHAQPRSMGPPNGTGRSDPSSSSAMPTAQQQQQMSSGFFPFAEPLDPSLRHTNNHFPTPLDSLFPPRPVPAQSMTSLRTSYTGNGVDDFSMRNGESSSAGVNAGAGANAGGGVVGVGGTGMASSSSNAGSGVGYNKSFSSFAFPMDLKSDPSLLWLEGMLDPSGGGIGVQSFGLPLDPNYGDLGRFPTEQAQLLSLESPEHAMGLAMLPSPAGSAGTLGSAPTVGATGLHHPNSGGGLNDLLMAGNMSASAAAKQSGVVNREPQLEDVTTWANISHFISLFLQYLYPLLPLVHRPTFTEHLATRRDLKDTDFRALLLSIVAYVISQLPTSRLVTDQFDIEGLKRLQRRCHRTGKQLQRTYYGPTNLTQITTIIFDNFYLLSIGLGHTAGARLGQAVNLAYSMGMHSDERTAALGLDAVEVQLRRRVFWQMYVSDKTRAIPGLPMLMNDFQGVPSLPEPTDDEHITSQGYFPQPTDRTSVLAGFVWLSKMFIIISECFFHHRSVASATTLALPHVGIEWTYSAEDRLHGMLRDLPDAIQDPLKISEPAARQVFAMQRANVLITAAIAKFALYDLRAALHVDEEQLAREREVNAREIYTLLMNIPVEDLASNGESVRAKVFHIACALCSQIGASGTDQDLIRDWCNMFSTISFVQMPPPAPGAPQLESRANSPPDLSGLAGMGDGAGGGGGGGGGGAGHAGSSAAGSVPAQVGSV